MKNGYTARNNHHVIVKNLSKLMLWSCFLKRQWLRARLPGTQLRAGLALHHATTRHPSRVLTGAVWP